MRSVPLEGGYYYDLDGNIEPDESSRATNVDSCGNIPAAHSETDELRVDLVTASVDHSFA